MEVIIEYVLLDNFVIDCILLYCTHKLLRLPTNEWGIVLASTCGAVFALFSPLLNFDGVYIVLIKLFVALVMTLVAGLSFYKLFLRFLCFVALTFLFGGMLIALCYFAGVNVVQGASIMYFSEIPLGSVSGLGFVFLLFCVHLCKRIWQRVKFTQFLCKVDLTINSKTITLDGFLDSGNNLRTKDNVPIIILKEEDLKFWFSFSDRMNILMGKCQGVKLKNPQKVNISSVGNSTNILVFEADNLCIQNRNYSVAVGIDNSRHFKNFSILLNNEMGEALC